MELNRALFSMPLKSSYIVRMDRRLKLTALNYERKVDHKQYRLRRDNQKGIRYVERDERIRQQYFRVWVKKKIHRKNTFALVNIAFVLEEQGINTGVKGWFVNTLDEPFGVHGVLEGTKTQFKRFMKFLDDWKDEEEIDCYVRNKGGSYIDNYTFNNLGYLRHPYKYHEIPMEERVAYDLMSGTLDR